MKKVIAIVGSREYPNLEDVKRFIDVNLDPKEHIIISGGARGVDTVAVAHARSLGFTTAVYYAEWDLFGSAAGMIRNTKLVEQADEVVAFWDGKSNGTMDTVKKARAKKINVTVYS